MVYKFKLLVLITAKFKYKDLGRDVKIIFLPENLLLQSQSTSTRQEI